MLSSLKNIPPAWSNFWFKPAAFEMIRPLRFGIAVACSIWIASFFPNVSVWFGDGGLLSHDLSSRTIAYEGFDRWQLWSPLWLAQSTTLIQCWLVIGCLLTIAGAVGWLGRIPWGFLCLWCIAWTHRIGWLAGPTEPLMIAMTAYVTLQPGSRWNWKQRETSVNSGWTANASLRLLQVHSWILLAAGVLMQLASLIWWRGEAVWWLAAADRSNSLSTATLANRAYLVNAFTHGWILIELLALWLLVPQSTRPLGVLLAWISCCCIGLLADQACYAILLAAGFSAFWFYKEESSPREKR
ncbi:MAG: hypothetical protein AB8B50_18180 [Pirellulaceae bacterium]